MTVIPIAIFTAYLLDLVFGDPEIYWHPVRIIGRLIERLERTLNNDKLNKRLAGLLVVFLVISLTVIFILLILKLGSLLHPTVYFIIYGLSIYFALAVKSLAQEANKVYTALLSGNIIQARKSLSMIVARDTERLDERQVVRATVETVAESTMDGIISPLFYVFLGGPVLAWAYKAINTLDSMVGYKNTRFADFGRIAAKIDAIANLIPAKIACFAIFLAGLFCQKYRRSAMAPLRKYFFKSMEYNSESTEAVMASILGVQLGGTNFYNSIPVQKNIIGENLNPLEIKHIRESIKIAYIASGLTITAGMFLAMQFGRR